ncbi:NUDIX hydrolase [Candidatus Gottesmanbacteria bacterium]|nr:NUDIX hydrolase [Candidatus Gottesmanbacteria bacterium]
MITCIFEDGNKGLLRHVVVHAIVVQDGKILLEKRAANLTNGNLWAMPGGFLNRDETAAQGALRELKEETGWEGKIISLFSIITRPDRPKEDRQNVAFVYLVKPLRQTGKPDTESSEVLWVLIDTLPPLKELAFDHGESIGLYLKYRQRPFSLPLLL